jgi:hypothetical protein
MSLDLKKLQTLSEKKSENLLFSDFYKESIVELNMNLNYEINDEIQEENCKE